MMDRATALATVNQRLLGAAIKDCREGRITLEQLDQLATRRGPEIQAEVAALLRPAPAARCACGELATVTKAKPPRGEEKEHFCDAHNPGAAALPEKLLRRA